MPRHRSDSVEFKRLVAQEFLNGETLNGLARRHDLSRNLIRIWVDKYEAGALDEHAQAADVIQEYEARMLRSSGLSAVRPSSWSFKSGLCERTPAERRAYIRNHQPRGLSVAQGCRLLGIARSNYYDVPMARVGDIELLIAVRAIGDEFEAYAWRRVRPALHHQGVPANHKRIKRPMREHNLRPSPPAPLRRHHR